jgi:hypothetical protein
VNAAVRAFGAEVVDVDAARLARAEAEQAEQGDQRRSACRPCTDAWVYCRGRPSFSLVPRQ